MDKCLLDTNFLIYLLDESSISHKKARAMLANFKNQNFQLFISHLIIAEFIHVFFNLLNLAGERKKFAQLKKALEKISLIPTLSLISPPQNFTFHQQIVQFMEEYKLTTNDAYILALMRHHNINILASFDKRLLKTAKRIFEVRPHPK